ncbi:MAG TPA: PilZ domain-containing protein [Candidatus Hydrogenedentes bacterium]|nr:PilZ domain-containing protein [Candidatus Hydrogenedentota bacterium]HOS02123.1 PilZ domain-containing protein [Candidatus Hydrogenedentota bacterium]
MPNTALFYIISDTDTRLLAPVALVCVFFIAVAIVSEISRQRMRTRARIRGEWDVVRKVSSEKGLSADEQGLLERLIRRYSPRAPVSVVTVRQSFDACVSACLGELDKINSPEFETTGALLRDVRDRIGLHYLPFGPSIRSTRELHASQPVLFAAGIDQADRKGARGLISDITEAVFYVTPEEGTNLEAFTPGNAVHFSLWREDDARYAFQARLVRVESDPVRLAFRHAVSLNRMQSREYYRIGFEQSASVGILNASVDGSDDDVRLRPVVTRTRGRFTNLSAGGFAILIPQPVPRQVLLRVTLQFDGFEPFDVEARIVSVLSLPGGQYLVRASYVGISEDVRDRITRFIFRRQQPLLHHADAASGE